MSKLTNIVVAGLGGQGVLKASDIIADVAFHAGLDVKKSEVHGMSQRGGSVASDVRYGECVYSPMVPAGQAEYLVVVSADQVEVNIAAKSPTGVLIEPSQIDESKLKSKRAMNVALLGVLSRYLEFSDEQWVAAIKRNFPEKLHDSNIETFFETKNAAAAK